MREYKFRIWDTQEKKFYQPTHEAYNGKLDVLFIALDGTLVRQTMTGLVHESLFPDRYIKQQYTGLHDKRGTPIFEGDIVMGTYDYGSYGNPAEVVTYEHGTWNYSYALQETGEHPERDWEIIGNRYEHPELLSEGK